MSRTGLLIALGIAAAVGLVFGFYPELDLALSRPFYMPDKLGRWFSFGTPVQDLRTVAAWVIAVIAAPAFIALAIKLILPPRPLFMPGRAMVLMIVTLALAPGLLANVILKDEWGRPRPAEITEFGGSYDFVAWWDPRGECAKNCSFVAGEPSGAFWTLAPAALAPAPWRPIAYGAALAFGAAVGLLRIVAGGHFFTDVVFSGVFTFMIIWLVHGLLYRWPATQITDAAVELALERLAMPMYRSVLRMLARRRDAPAPTKDQGG